MKRKSIGLIAFLRGNTNPEENIPGCANYDHHNSSCLLADVCLIQEGKRCSYFEKNVLPTAIDINLRESVYLQYAKVVGVEINTQSINRNYRSCPDCGAELRSRQRYCETCKNRHRRQSYRNSRLKRNS